MQNLRIAHSLTVSEMIYTGFVRVPVGIIAAGVSILLVSGDWILGGLDDTSRYYSVYLLGFVAGFAEQFVPNVLGRIESTSRADLNGASDTAPG